MRIALGFFFLSTFIALQGKTTWDGVYSDAQAKRGEELYAKSCASCHGADLSGLDTAPTLAGPDFAAGWDKMTLGDLVERVQTSMPADAPRSLKRQEYVDIVSFLLSKNGFPAGQDELSVQSDALKGIAFVSQKK